MEATFFRMIMMTLVAVFGATLGDVLLSIGMRKVGQMPAGFDVRVLVSFFGRALTNPWILVGIACLAVYFFSWLALLSWADLSLVLPMTALTFVMAAFLARFWLGETVSLLRWAGTLVIALGVFLVTLSGTHSLNSLPSPDQKAPAAVESATTLPQDASPSQP